MKKTSKYFILGLLLVMGISLGYALISSTLTITGTASVKSNNFSVIFTKVEDESISNRYTTNARIVSPATIDPNDNTKINFSVVIDKPGDVYTFKAYRKNNGTINATLATTDGVVITGMHKEVNGEQVLKYNKLKLSIVDPDATYNISGNIYNNLMADPDLDVNEEDYVIVKLEYDDNIVASDLLDTELSLDIQIDMNYVQK